MKTLITANQKGGVGKTATLVHLAFDFHERGQQVAVIDLDTQANASYTLNDYRSGLLASQFFNGGPRSVDQEHNGMLLIESDAALADMETMPVNQAGESLRAGINTLAEQGFDVCLIDTAPSLGVSLAAALIAADYVLSPIELEAYSIQGIEKMAAAIAHIRQANPELQLEKKVKKKQDPNKLAKAIMLIKHDDRPGRLALHKRPTTEGLAWIKYDDDGQEIETDLADLDLVALIDGARNRV